MLIFLASSLLINQIRELRQEWMGKGRKEKCRTWKHRMQKLYKRRKLEDMETNVDWSRNRFHSHSHFHTHILTHIYQFLYFHFRHFSFRDFSFLPYLRQSSWYGCYGWPEHTDNYQRARFRLRYDIFRIVKKYFGVGFLLKFKHKNWGLPNGKPRLTVGYLSVRTTWALVVKKRFYLGLSKRSAI